jgi:hypothetical protein
MPKRQQTPRISRADARARFLDNVIPYMREQVEAFEAGARSSQTPDPDNCRLIADEGRKILNAFEKRRARSRTAAAR